MKTSELLIASGAGFVGRNLIRVLYSSDYDMGMMTVCFIGMMWNIGL